MRRRGKNDTFSDPDGGSSSFPKKPKQRSSPMKNLFIAVLIVIVLIETYYLATLRPLSPVREKNSPVSDSKKALKKERSILDKVGVDPEDDFHTVVSSGCSAYQNWQVEVLLHSWWKIGQAGAFTRIVSGCADDEQRVRAMKTAVPVKINYFFTPDFAPPPNSKVKAHGKFFFFNKPYGVKLWFESVYIKESVIMLIDPDMIIQKKFTNHIPGDEYYVSEGSPAGATYGIGAKWVPWKLCDEPINDCEINEAGAWKYYSVGPPYIMHRNDWLKLVPRWAYYSPGALERDPPPSVLAEMYSFSIAAAELNLRIKLTPDFMLSSMGGNEPWHLANWDLKKFGPHITHYCHSYWIGTDNDHSSPKASTPGFNFHKGHMPRHILEDCELPLLAPAPVDDNAKSLDHDKNKGNVYMIHWVIKGINEAMLNYKQTYCPGFEPKYDIYLQQPAHWNQNKMWYMEGSEKAGSNPAAHVQLND